jgi:hydroxypyruvate isomerase
VKRRAFLGAAGAAALGTVPGSGRLASAGPHPGRLRQSVCRWPFESVPMEEFLFGVARIGLDAVDLLYPDEWGRAEAHGLGVSTGYASRRPGVITEGFNDPLLHDMLISELTEAIPLAAAARVPNLLVMSGNRRGDDPLAGVVPCVEGLRQIAPFAERRGVTLVLEMLNSIVDHPGYDADSLRYGLEVVHGVGSPAVRLLYDVYHMQIMEGNVIATLRDHRHEIVHVHTAGVPGRHELDGSQELNYRAIANALAELGFEGFIAHEFKPTRPPMQALREAVEVCTV